MIKGRVSKWKVLENSLPDNITEQILDIERSSKGKNWTLLREGNTRRIYKYSPHAKTYALLVKWLYHKPFFAHHSKNLRGNRSEFKEWHNHIVAMESGIYTPAFYMLAVKKKFHILTGMIQVFEFIPLSERLDSFLYKNYHNKSLVMACLKKLGKYISKFHDKNLIHQDLSLDNILIINNNPDEIVFIDLLKLQKIAPDEKNKRLKDLILPVIDLMIIGFCDEIINIFLDSYIASSPEVSKDISKKVFKEAKNRLIHIVGREMKNCLTKSRRLKNLRIDKYKVFLFMGSDYTQIEIILGERDRYNHIKNGDLTLLRHIQHGVPGFRKDTLFEKWWRISCAMNRIGIPIHGALGIAVKKNLFQKEVIFFKKKEQNAFKVADVLKGTSDSAIPLKQFLSDTGHFFRRLHLVGIYIKRFNIDEWKVFKNHNGYIEITTSNPGVF
ncbi:MAG: lipopolysaccharide kinase InaA family protein, partial [Thermodesulfobacteriota bacterium]|nr:lipopolysaccharide kinase InaA family protein [Thermodesulfobacteriota bacterium]